MKTKIEIKSYFGSLLFELECENNSIKNTVLEAVKSSANLRSANLRGADLRDADLRSADLRDADLRDANLRSAENKEFAKIPMFCKWSHSIIGEKIQIGCKQKTIDEWDLFFNSDGTFETERGTDNFKQIQAVFEACKAYLNFLNK